jgi:hypothetical protein
MASGYALSNEALTVLFETEQGQRVELSGLRERPISKSFWLSLKPYGWPSPEAAGKRLADAFLLAFVRSRVGVESATAGIAPTDRERIALDLFNASFFEPAAIHGSLRWSWRSKRY